MWFRLPCTERAGRLDARTHLAILFRRPDFWYLRKLGDSWALNFLTFGINFSVRRGGLAPNWRQ
jgi:hypothetical protein